MANRFEQSGRLMSRLEALPFSRWHKALFLVAFFGTLFDAADFALFGGALPLISREFGLGPAQAGLLATIGLVGAFVGALFWGTISDYIGRRTGFRTTVGIYAIFTGLVAASWSLGSLAAFRFLSNFGLGGEVPVATTLTAEFMPSRIRGRVTGNMLAAFPVGLLVAAGLSLYILPRFGWRWLFVVGIVPAIILYFARRHMPESVRYLLSKGKIEEAERTVAQIELRATGKAGEAPPDLGIQAEIGTAEHQGVTVLQLLAPGRRRRTILLWIVSFCFLWSSNGILFMLPTIMVQRGLPLTQALTFQLIQAFFAIFGYSACSFLIDFYGRRPVLFLYYLVGAAFHFWFAIATGAWLYVAAALVGWVNPGVFGPSAIYAGELYPTHLRATAVGWFFGIGRIGSFLAPTVVGLMLAFGLGNYVMQTFALAFLIAAIAIILVGIETKGLVLEKISETDTGGDVRLAAAPGAE